MKRIVYSSLVLFAALFAFETIASAQAAQTVPLYRVYGRSHHFYTTNKAERDSAVRTAHYKDEGIAGYVFDKPVSGTIPLYRFVKEGTLDGTRHYYATNPSDRAAAIRDGYKSEGICCYISYDATNGAVPFYHLYLKPNPHSDFSVKYSNGYGDDHLYTTNEREKFDAINKYAYVIQADPGYLWTKPYMVSPPKIRVRQ